MAKFNVGDRVLVGPQGLLGVKAAAAKIGVIIEDDDGIYHVKFSEQIPNDTGYCDDRWWAVDDIIALVAPDGGTELRSPTIVPTKRAMQRASYRLNQEILKHLESGKSISPMEALVVHGCLRLAAAICDLRQVGHNIKTDIHRDSNGKQYARYSLTSGYKAAA